jgi:hypothetical protein
MLCRSRITTTTAIGMKSLADVPCPSRESGIMIFILATTKPKNYVISYLTSRGKPKSLLIVRRRRSLGAKFSKAWSCAHCIFLNMQKISRTDRGCLEYKRRLQTAPNLLRALGNTLALASKILYSIVCTRTLSSGGGMIGGNTLMQTCANNNKYKLKTKVPQV